MEISWSTKIPDNFKKVRELILRIYIKNFQQSDRNAEVEVKQAVVNANCQ